MVPLSNIYDKITDDDAVWYFDPQKTKDMFRCVMWTTQEETECVRAISVQDFKRSENICFWCQKHWQCCAVRPGWWKRWRGSVIESTLSSTKPSRKIEQSCWCVRQEKGLRNNKSQNSVLDAIVHMICTARLKCLKRIYRHVKVVTMRVCPDFMLWFRITTKTRREVMVYQVVQVHKATPFDSWKDFNKAQQVLVVAKMSVPSVKQLKLTGAGHLLDTVSKRIRNKELRNQALKIIGTWKSELKLRRSKVVRGWWRHCLLLLEQQRDNTHDNIVAVVIKRENSP